MKTMQPFPNVARLRRGIGTFANRTKHLPKNFLAVVALSVSGIVYCLSDMDYLIRSSYYFVKNNLLNRLAGRLPLTDGQRRAGLVLPKSLDFNLHVNNAKYLRICDYAIIQWVVRTGVWETLKKLNAGIVVSATSIRYRRSLLPFDRYHLSTKLVGWDRRAFYLEHRFLRDSDQFLCCVVFIKYSFVGCSAEEFFEQFNPLSKDRAAVDFSLVENLSSVPESLRLWRDSIVSSSQELRKEFHLSD